jgi:hypothetical protein
MPILKTLKNAKCQFLKLYYFRRTCSTCGVDYDAESDSKEHTNHQTHLVLGSTYFSLGWGHLEARLQTCLIQVPSTQCNQII